MHIGYKYNMIGEMCFKRKFDLVSGIKSKNFCLYAFKKPHLYYIYLIWNYMG